MIIHLVSKITLIMRQTHDALRDVKAKVAPIAAHINAVISARHVVNALRTLTKVGDCCGRYLMTVDPLTLSLLGSLS